MNVVKQKVKQTLEVLASKGSVLSSTTVAPSDYNGSTDEKSSSSGAVEAMKNEKVRGANILFIRVRAPFQRTTFMLQSHSK